MENTICPDVLTLIYKLIPYHVKNLALTSKYCYNTLQTHKKQLCTGNYILSKIQQTMIDDMESHINTLNIEPLIIQSNISTGKTAAILAFSLKCNHTVVIMVPYSIMSHWILEIKKMYHGNTQYNQFEIIHPNYDKKLYNTCKLHLYNPKSVGKKVIIVSSIIKTPIKVLTQHSLVIMDEVHKMGIKIYNNPKFIGVSASNAGWHHCHQKIYSHEEELPLLKYNDLILKEIDINSEITKIQLKNTGPYLILCNTKIKSLITVPYLFYDKKYDTLININKLNNHESVLLCPGSDSTGINLNYIKCIIFVYPVHHLNDTVIQSLGRVTRTTNMNQSIQLYNLHKNQEEIIMHRATVSENEIIKFCNDNDLKMIKNARNKNYLLEVIKKLLVYDFNILMKMNKLYYTSLLRIQKRDFNKINKLIGDYLNVDVDMINNIIK